MQCGLSHRTTCLPWIFFAAATAAVVVVPGLSGNCHVRLKADERVVLHCTVLYPRPRKIFKNLILTSKCFSIITFPQHRHPSARQTPSLAIPTQGLGLPIRQTRVLEVEEEALLPAQHLSVRRVSLSFCGKNSI